MVEGQLNNSPLEAPGQESESDPGTEMDFLCQFNSSFPSVVIVSPKETTNSKDCLTCYESLHGDALGNLNVWWCDQVRPLHPYVEHLFLEGLCLRAEDEMIPWGLKF